MSRYSQACSYPRLAAFSGLAPLTLLKVDFRLCWHFSRVALQEDEVLAKAKAAVKLSLAHRSPRGLRNNTDFFKICIQFLYFLLITGLSHLVLLCSGRRFDVFTQVN